MTGPAVRHTGAGRIILATLAILTSTPMVGAVPDDTTPPVITAITFDQEVYVPGDLVLVTLSIDDESDVVHASATIRDTGSPLVLFVNGCKGSAPGNWTCKIQIPDKAPGGTFVLNQVQAEDEIGHSTNLYGPSLDPWRHLQVAIESPYTDRSPPTISNITVTPLSVQPGEYVTVSFDAHDETGTAYTSVSLSGGIHSTGLDTGCHFPAEGPPICTCMPENASHFVCNMEVRHGMPAGDYRVAVVSATDDIGYRAILERNDSQLGALPTVHIDSNVTDRQPPRLLGIEMPDLPVPRGGKYSIPVKAADDSPLKGTMVRVQTTHGNALLDTYDCTGAESTNGVVACTGEIRERFPLGWVRLQFVVVADIHGNAANYFMPGELGCPTCFWVEPNALNETKFLVGPGPLEVLDEIPVVTALDPFFTEVAPGHVLPIVLQNIDTVTNVTFVFVNTVTENASAILGAVACQPDANLTLIGSLCHLIIPRDATPGEYVLQNVTATLSNGTIHTLRLDATKAPAFIVDADADTPTYPLPVEWQDQVKHGVTVASFNAPGNPFSMPILVTPGRPLVAARITTSENHLPFPNAINDDSWEGGQPQGGSPDGHGFARPQTVPAPALAGCVVALFAALGLKRK